MSIGAIIVAAGMGRRAGGDVPKQLQSLLGKPVYRWSVDALLAEPAISEIVLVVPIGRTSEFDTDLPDRVIRVEGGETRTQSVLSGLAALSLEAEDIVLIHDAARPGLSPPLIASLIGALETADAAAPALPVTDALKREDGKKLQTVSRDGVWRVQTPQAFRYGQITSALQTGGDNLVDDLVAVEAQGAQIALVEGCEALAKITLPGDLERMSRLLAPTPPVPRVGQGFDVHAFEPGDGVMLCGVLIPHTAKLAGHSDADVGWHALTDAILGAIGEGDIGDHFPPSDPTWRGADSRLFLAAAVDIAKARGFQLTSCDITLICEAPKIKPHRTAMRERTAEVTGLNVAATSVKATTTEGLGFAGRKEGIAAQAVAVLSPLPISS
ncbi:MAG: bifunctional 2-C-methyl-D-erythritol 4-phosphate cytidylyltransferase/2-C-methyl-D-erythritol 2,4-cyclodiphosphate synthase [Pseudomonadota bacterium]